MVSVVGDGRKFITALVVPEFDNIRTWLKDKHGKEIADNQELINSPEVKALIEERVLIVNQTLARYEQIKKYVILPDVFSEQTGELTPSQKKKRRVIETKYKNKIDEMYPKD
jgi:long-chain acyl-CoA synthetase